MDAGTYAFWFFAIACWLAFTSVAIKLKWWKYSLGYWFFISQGCMAFIALFIFLLQIGAVPDWARAQARFFIYGPIGVVKLALVVDIWRKNIHHWAWSKDDAA